MVLELKHKQYKKVRTCGQFCTVSQVRTLYYRHGNLLSSHSKTRLHKSHDLPLVHIQFLFPNYIIALKK